MLDRQPPTPSPGITGLSASSRTLYRSLEWPFEPVYFFNFQAPRNERCLQQAILCPPIKRPPCGAFFNGGSRSVDGPVSLRSALADEMVRRTISSSERREFGRAAVRQI